MALKNGKPNPLNYFGLRRVEFAAPHFKYTTIDRYNPTLLKGFDNWIRQNLNNRYFIGQCLALDNTNTIVYNTRIGFESEKELSFFTIACPLLQQR
jgi:transposase